MENQTIFIIIIGIILVMLFLTVIVWYNPNLFFKPINMILKLDNSERRLFYSNDEKEFLFPLSKELELNWEIIRDECYNIYNMLKNKKINYLNKYHLDIETKEWTTIPLKLFGWDKSYMELRKEYYINKILVGHPEIKSCIISIMEPGKIIEAHVGPYDGLLRYQLALDIPQSNIDNCHIQVGDQKHHWTNGEGILFDETNVHSAINLTGKKRMVLLIDINRPYNFLPFRYLNDIIISSMGFISR